MGRHSRPAEKPGGLHGTWLKVLGAASLAIIVVAVWQLTTSSSDSGQQPTGDAAELSLVPTSSAPDTGTAGSSPSPSESPSPSPSPSPSAEEESTEPPVESAEAEPPTGRPDCSATLRLDDSWEGSIQATVTVTASGGTIDGWQVDLGLDDAEVYQFWNMTHHHGDKYRNEGWNGGLSTGEGTEAGFQAEVGDDYELPGSVPCKAFS